MSKKIISGIFLILFIALIITPTVIVLVDDTIDITVVLSDSGEEEGKKGNEKKINIELIFPITKALELYSVRNNLECGLDYFYKKYTKPHLNIISPPPDLYNL
jgi:hypothetical protein